MSERFDVVVVGSGAGGGVVAGELAERGRSVLLLECGPHLTAADFSRWEAKATHDLKAQGGKLLHDRMDRSGGIAELPNISARFHFDKDEPNTRKVVVIELATAADDGVRPAFERYRRELADQSLPPFLSADYALQTGRGLRLMGEFNAAKSWLEAAVQTAQQHQIHQFLHESQMELELARAGAGAWKGPEPEPDLSVDIAEVVDAVRNMREAVEVGD